MESETRKVHQERSVQCGSHLRSSRQQLGHLSARCLHWVLYLQKARVPRPFFGAPRTLTTKILDPWFSTSTDLPRILKMKLSFLQVFVLYIELSMNIIYQTAYLHMFSICTIFALLFLFFYIVYSGVFVFSTCSVKKRGVVAKTKPLMAMCLRRHDWDNFVHTFSRDVKATICLLHTLVGANVCKLFGRDSSCKCVH